MNGGKSLQEYHRQAYRLQDMVAVCPSMQQVLSVALQIVDVPTANVLLIGETGTGKDTLAKCLHYSSSRWDQPFVPINCAAIPEALLESELFGHEPGAFTGARGRKQGLLEIAAGGTVFLNEIADMSLSLQAKLLAATEDLHFYRVGGTELVQYNARIIAAINRNIQDAILDRSFRADLYYRLNTIQLRLPPLRERKEDLLPLAKLFIQEMCERHGRLPVRELTHEVLECLRKHRWPGNIRELRQVIERAVILSRTDKITVDDILIDTVRLAPGIQITEEGNIKVEFPPDGIALETVERILIERALQAAHGVQAHAAKLLHISRDTLRYRIQKYGLTGTNPHGDKMG